MRKRARNYSELAKLIVTASTDQVHMLRKTKFLVKGEAQVTNR
jgi:hypothetical protein